MRFTFISTLLLVAALTSTMQAASGKVAAMRDVVPDGYDFWLYAPEEYDEKPHERFPVIIFMHGASLCGRDMKRSRRYGVLDAVEKGREINALIITPQNPGGSWKPHKINAILEYVVKNCRVDTSRVYVIGMSLGGYGTMDFVGTYPEKVAAAMALCGGCTLNDCTGLGDAPLWIIHGTADRAVRVGQSKKVVKALHDAGKDSLLRYEWIPGMNHSQPSRYFYLAKTYEWLFSHSLNDNPRKVNREITISAAERKAAYSDISSRDTPIATVTEIK